jgi:hypothetical protein
MAATGIDMRVRLAVLWTFVMINMIYADIVTFMRADALEGFLAGSAEGLAITPPFLLIVALVTEIPIAMVVLSMLLPRRGARLANVAAGIFTIVYVWGGASLAPYYILFGTVETIACLLAIRWAWSWRTAAEPDSAPAVDSLSPARAARA